MGGRPVSRTVPPKTASAAGVVLRCRVRIGLLGLGELMNRGDRGDQLFVGESLEKGDQSGFVVRTESKTRFRVLGQVRIESSGAVRFAVVLVRSVVTARGPDVE